MDNQDYEEREQEEVVLRVTAHYVEEVQAGYQPDISDYLARYPQYADAIASFIAYYHTVELPATQSSSGSSDFLDATNAIDTTVDTGSTDEFADIFPIAIESAWQRVLASETVAASEHDGKIGHMPETGKLDEVGENMYGQPIESLFIAAKQQRLSPTQLAAYLNISEDIVMLLEQQALLSESIPLELYRRLAKMLNQPVHTVQNYFSTERYRQVAEHPEVYDAGNVEGAENTLHSGQKVSFREAITNSEELSAEQKSSWHAVLLEEGM